VTRPITALPTATVQQLLDALADEPDKSRPVRIWLPGSTIALTIGSGTLIRRGDTILIEGNVDPGSALDG
jgi:hypothetical protein